MSSFRKPFLAVMGLVLLASFGSIWAQGSILYNGLDTQLQTRNVPAGTVVDPGSQLLYVIDTGVNVRQAVGAANLPLYSLGPLSQRVHTSGGSALPDNPFGVGGARSIFDGNGNLNPELINRSFITITNTHPTQAVTVHFRYFNDECVDFLDFLVVLTCNDTLIFNPLDFDIPRTPGPLNTRSRIFGPAQGVLSPIPASLYASGRFLIQATAAGTSYEPQNQGVQNDNAELRFPFEFSDLISNTSDCDNLRDDTYFGLNPSLRSDNLHPFNASAVAFNYLVGGSSTAVPLVINGVPAFQSWGLNAWTRPAVDLTVDLPDSLRDEADGDGPPLTGINDFRILTGSEVVRASDGNNVVQTNFLYLRNDVHAGDTAQAPGYPGQNIDGGSAPDFDSQYGALGLISLFGANPADQLVNFVSFIDDYNGSRHATDPFSVRGFRDRSYNLFRAETTYVLQIYDNDENLFTLTGAPPPNVSPLPPEDVAELNIVVDCLRVWVTTARQAQFSVDDLQISELDSIVAGITTFIGGGPDPDDLSRGWIRFVRDHSNEGEPYGPECAINSAGHQAGNDCTQRGTWAGRNTANDGAGNASFVTIGYQVVKFSGFGAAWWLPTVASDPLVSELGIPDPQ